MGVGYGFLSMIKTQMNEDTQFDNFDTVQPRNGLQVNLAHHPKHTYIFDEFDKDQLESILDNIKLFTNVELGISMENFVMHEREASNLFVPVCSFDDSTLGNANNEMVAIIEGIVYPWFGFAYRLDRIQYSLEQKDKDMVDHSKEAIQHA